MQKSKDSTIVFLEVVGLLINKIKLLSVFCFSSGMGAGAPPLEATEGRKGGFYRGLPPFWSAKSPLYSLIFCIKISSS